MGSLCIRPTYNNSKSFLQDIKGNFDENYALGESLGRGNFSEVRKATSQGQHFAVKIIRLAQIRHEIYLLKREIEILRQLECPYIIKCRDLFQSPDYVYIVLDLCEGGNLKAKIETSGPQSEGTVKEVALAALRALEYLHLRGICHRDIKPENILFSGEGVKVADFGLARVMSGTQALSVVGTPYYLAPEVVDGTYNSKCDIWSLGVVLYYALTARLPFVGKDFEELLARIKSAPVCWDGVSEGARVFLEQLLNKDYHTRSDAGNLVGSKWIN